MIQKYIIYSKPITKKNSPRIGYVGAHCPVCHKGKYAKVLPSAAYLKYARTAKMFLKPAPKNPLDGRYNVKCLYYMPTRHRVDKTNLESAIMDILVDARILKDDNSNIVAATDGSRVLYDKSNPRTEIFIEELEVQPMKARLHPTPAMQKAIDAYAEAKIQGIQSRAQEAVMKERNDIATRATYLCLLACYQVGLSPRTLKRIQDAMTGPVADKYNEYRNDQLADLWAQVTLQGIGIDAPKTEEPL